MTPEEYDRQVAETMREEVLLVRVLELAKLYGWRSAHFRPAQTQRGRWVTAVQGDGKGYPDVTLVHGPAGRLVFAELKAQRGRFDPAQVAWLDDLRAVAEDVAQVAAYSAAVVDRPPVSVHTWRPADLLDGRIEAVLGVSAAHRAAALR